MRDERSTYILIQRTSQWLCEGLKRALIASHNAQMKIVFIKRMNNFPFWCISDYAVPDGEFIHKLIRQGHTKDDIPGRIHPPAPNNDTNFVTSIYQLNISFEITFGGGRSGETLEYRRICENAYVHGIEIFVRPIKEI